MVSRRIGMAIATVALMLAGTMAMSRPAEAQTRFSLGIGVGSGYGYYAPQPVYRPPYPGPGYYWTDGYYDPYGAWISGFWAPRAYVAPRGYYNTYYRRDFDRDDYRRYDRDEYRGHDRGRGNGRGRHR